MKEVVLNLFILLTLIPAFWVAFSRNIVHAAFALLATLFGIAGLFALLGADFLAVVQVLLYIGGILILILFGIMMTHRADVRLPAGVTGRLWGGLLSFLLFLGLVVAVVRYPWRRLPLCREPMPTSERIGDLILGKYLMAFEVASVLLLAALVVAALIVRRTIRDS